jgi:23S rRNA (guanosine2251-2'-O)-methyltransferase
MQFLILDNIRSAHNVGAIFRTADGAGVVHLFLTGITPAPTDRFGRPVPAITKTALGASDTVPYTVCPLGEALKAVAANGATIVAVEQSDQSVSLVDFTPPERVAYILGNEITGVSSEGLDKAAMIVSLPQYGVKESLNVSVVAGIMVYHTLMARAQRIS